MPSVDVRPLRESWAASPAAAIALVYLAVVSAADVVLGDRAVLIGLLSIGPSIAAYGASMRATILVAALAIALAVGLAWPDEIQGTLDHLVRVTVVVAASFVALAFVRLRSQREEALRRVTEVANVAQRAILRQPPPRIAHVALTGAYLSAADEALVGGDLYETALTTHGVRLIVGDVKGKGLDAVGLAARVLSTFREHALQCAALADLACAIDKDVASVVDDEEFVTGVLVEFPFDEDVVRVVNCGHHPPLRVRPDGQVLVLRASVPDLPFGLAPDPSEESFELRDGDRLLVYTDGLVEARSPAGEEFPVLDLGPTLAAGELGDRIDDLVGRVRAHVGHGVGDDLAVLLCERLPSP